MPSGTFLPVVTKKQLEQIASDKRWVKSVTFQLRMTEEENTALEEIAKAYGISKSAMVRGLILIERDSLKRVEAREAPKKQKTKKR